MGALLEICACDDRPGCGRLFRQLRRRAIDRHRDSSAIHSRDHAGHAWPGMAGVVSGMNRAGVSVAVNGAPSELAKKTATPGAIVARANLEQGPHLDRE